MKHITYNGLKRLINNKADFLLIDVRLAEKFAENHIPGAINIPWRQLALLEHQEKLKSAHALIIYCSGFTCNASEKAGAILDILGYKVVEYDGGMEDWEANQ